MFYLIFLFFCSDTVRPLDLKMLLKFIQFFSGKMSQALISFFLLIELKALCFNDLCFEFEFRSFHIPVDGNFP